MVISKFGNRYDLKSIVNRSGRFTDVESLPSGKMIFSVFDTTDDIEKILKIDTNIGGEASSVREEFNVFNDLKKGGDLSHIVNIYDEGIIKFDGFEGILLEKGSHSVFDEFLFRKDEPYDLDEIKDIIRQSAEGLIVAHKLGIIHCDYKPSNTIVFNKEAGIVYKVGDFANATTGTDTTTLLRGSHDYMAPESSFFAKGGVRHSKASDVYALAITLFQLAHPNLETPYTVFNDKTSRSFTEAKKDPEQSSTKIELEKVALPDELKKLVLDATTPDPKSRIQSVEKFLERIAFSESPVVPKMEKAYQRLVTEYETISGLVKDATPGQVNGVDYGTLPLETIDGINTVYRLAKQLSHFATEYGTTSYGPKFKEVQNEVTELKRERNRLAKVDYNNLDALISNGGHYDLAETQDHATRDVAQIMFCWGPPFTQNGNQRKAQGKVGKAWYPLKEIQSGEYLNALPEDIKERILKCH